MRGEDRLVNEKTEVIGPRLVRGVASEARKAAPGANTGQRSARIGERAGRGSTGGGKSNKAALGQKGRRLTSAFNRTVVAKGKRELRFRDLAELALREKESRGIKSSSLRADRVRLGVLAPVIGHLKISKFKPRTFAHALADIAASRSLSPASFNRYHALIGTICGYAVREELMDINPMADGRVQRRSEARIHVRYLERHEQVLLLAAIKRNYPGKADEVELAVLSGMRRGEQFHARWSDWKKKEGVLYVSGKTGPREVRINHAARRCLARMRRRARSGQLFITPERNISAVDRRLWFERAVKKAGLASHFRWHDMRHTFCSRLVAAGVPLLEVQQLAGHASYSTTLRYAHLSPDHRRKAVEKVRF
jgi:integrase